MFSQKKLTRSVAAAFAMALALVALAAPRSAEAGTRARRLVVNSAADDQSDGCGSALGQCTLREAIEAANARDGRDAILFHPDVFPEHSANPIMLTEGLPALVEPFGAVVSGAGAYVILDGSNVTTNSPGLVVSSGPGRKLRYPLVSDLVIRGFPGHGLLMCGGPYELSAGTCNEGIEDARVKRVYAEENQQRGIFVTGAPNRRTVIEDSTAHANGSRGINVNAGSRTALIRATVKRCTASNNQSRGIDLNASGLAYRSSVTDSIAIGNLGGINVNAGESQREPRVRGNTAVGNDFDGIVVNEGEGATHRADVRDNHVAWNMGTGLTVDAPIDSLIEGNVVSGNTIHGLRVYQGGRGTHLRKNVVNGNAHRGIDVYEADRLRIYENVAYGNGRADAEDTSPDCGRNAWYRNRFGSAAWPCIE